MTRRPDAKPGTKRRKRAPKRSRLTKSLIVCTWTLVPLLALAGIIVGGLYFRLSQGPISLKPLVASIESGISADLEGMTARIEDAFVVLGNNGIEFRLKKLELLEPDGDLVASAPLASAAISTTDLFKMRITPKRVFLIEPHVFLFYSDEGGLALSFSGSEADHDVIPPAPVPAKRPNASVIAKTTPPASERIDLARKMVELNERARRGITASYKLKEIGLQDASVTLVFAGQRSEWKVPSFVVDLDRTKTGASMSGKGRIDSGHGEWSFGFRTEEGGSDSAVKLNVELAEFVPSTLAKAVPRLSLLNTLDMRVAGKGSINLKDSGDVAEAKLDLAFGRGNINLPDVAQPLAIERGSVGLAFDGKSRELTVLPSTLNWGQSQLTIVGSAKQSGDVKSGDTQWDYALSSREGVLAAEDLGVAPIKVDALLTKGRLIPKTGRIEIEQALLRAGGGQISAQGEITSGVYGSNTRIEGKISDLKLDLVKTLWPRAFAAGARQWVGTKLSGDVRTGTIQILSGDHLAGAAEPGTSQRMTYALEAANLKANVLAGTAAMTASRALIRGENSSLEITIPDAELPAGPKGGVQIKNVRFTAVDLGTIMPMGDLTFRAMSPLASALDLARKVPDGPMTGVELPVETLDGKIDGQFGVKLPLIETVQKQDVKVVGKVKVSDIKAKPKTGAVELQGGTVNVDVTEAAAAAKGELILNGVVAKVDWQQALDAPEGTPPSPLKITARLDNSDRTQLGLDLNAMVQGDVPVEVTVERLPTGDNGIHLKADLTDSELIIEEVAWTKPAGRACTLDLDVGKMRPDGRVELQNLKIVGDDVAIEGQAILDPDNEMRDFSFPRFSLGLVSRLELTGKLNPKDKIWHMKAKGSTYDGKAFFDSLFNMGNSAAKVKPLRPANGADVEAEIGTVLGYQESVLKNFKMKMSTRKEKVVALDATGELDGGKTFKAVISSANNDRKLIAESNDAGRMFKIVGFYPNAQSGNMRMEVDLDGSGPAEKTGTLAVENFQVLGEPVFNELASSGQGQQRIQREVIDFDRMRVPFSVGHGQFVMNTAYLRGPVMGMTLTGKIDYKMGRVNIGGTYIPLQGINAAICDLPIFGQIVAGANCEGILGITFALQGSNKSPEVIVNPLSLVAPGIFRDIFQMTSSNPKITEREDAKPAAPAGKRTRASGSDAQTGSDDKAKTGTPGSGIDGWSSSESTEPNTKKR